jgi:phage shock protein A
MSFLRNLHDYTLGQANSLLNKAIDMNSIPMIEQHIRNLEQAQLTLFDQAAKAEGNIVTLTRQRDDVAHAIEHDKLVATAFLQKNDEKSAKAVASRIHDEQGNLDMFNQQITTATEQSQALDTQVELLKTNHAKFMAQLRSLKITDNARKGAALTSRSLQDAHNLVESGVDGSVDNLGERINAQNDQAQAELRRTIQSFEPPPDPLKDAAVDDILNSLRPATAAKV